MMTPETSMLFRRMQEAARDGNVVAAGGRAATGSLLTRPRRLVARGVIPLDGRLWMECLGRKLSTWLDTHTSGGVSWTEHGR